MGAYVFVLVLTSPPSSVMSYGHVAALVKHIDTCIMKWGTAWVQLPSTLCAQVRLQASTAPWHR